MSPYRRNVMVGAVVLCGLGILLWMLMQFGANIVTPFAPASIKIHFVAERADGLSSGSAVLYRGVTVGQIEKVTRADDGLRVNIDASIEKSPPLPANIQAVIHIPNLLGSGTVIDLLLDGDTPKGTLAEGAQFEALFGGLAIIPPELTQLANELRATAKQLRESNLVGHINDQVQNVGKLIDSVQTLVADPKLRMDLTASITNIREVTDKANRIAANVEKFSTDLPNISSSANQAIGDVRATVAKTQADIDDLSKQLHQRMEQVSGLLSTFESVATKIDKGQGTAGLLVNDPRLYENLVDTARELHAATADVKRLIEQWEKEGASLKLK
ncbi:MAG TPA: MlaD family protein [Tepidisphaeraceae bacterium]|nr:MlaD family protein [Tepidisphaeraceae bacterium]